MKHKKIAANLIVGAKPEKFLTHCLRSITEAVDEIIIVANPDNKNAEIMNVFPKVRVAYLPFKGFATARNNCLALSRDADYILRVDADEVHFTEQLKAVIQRMVDGNKDGAIAAFYHFIKDFRHYQSVDGRTILFRNKPGLVWQREVDEELDGLLPADLVNTDYRYHHYGYCKPQKEVWENWMQREEILGTREWFHDKDPDTVLDERKLIEYKGPYPDEMKDLIRRR